MDIDTSSFTETPLGETPSGETPPGLTEAPSTLTEAPAEVFAPRSTDVPVEIIMNSFRVTGELFAPGVPRRLVDILNSNDLPYFTMHSGTLDDPFNPGADSRSFDLIQVDKHGILFAVPRGDVFKPDPFEIVRKKPVRSTFVIPGYEISGDIHLMPDADPALVPIISDHHFVPLTDVTVAADKKRKQAWHEQLLIINMTRACFFGTKKSG